MPGAAIAAWERYSRGAPARLRRIRAWRIEEGEMADGPRVSFVGRYGPVIALVLIATVALLVVLSQPGVDASQVGRAYALGVGALVIGTVLLAFRRAAFYVPPPAPLAPPQVSRLPPELAQLQDALRASRTSRAHYEREVVPVLREIAADRLLSLGISLTRDPDRSAAVLGERLGAAISATGSPELARSRPAPSRADLAQLLHELEGVGR
ncbi:MAG TPA: hypothetical protein VI138_05075 [Candidatus Dormibacteraeota bacterium]